MRTYVIRNVFSRIALRVECAFSWSWPPTLEHLGNHRIDVTEQLHCGKSSLVLRSAQIVGCTKVKYISHKLRKNEWESKVHQVTESLTVGDLGKDDRGGTTNGPCGRSSRQARYRRQIWPVREQTSVKGGKAMMASIALIDRGTKCKTTKVKWVEWSHAKENTVAKETEQDRHWICSEWGQWVSKIVSFLCIVWPFYLADLAPAVQVGSDRHRTEQYKSIQENTKLDLLTLFGSKDSKVQGQPM